MRHLPARTCPPPKQTRGSAYAGFYIYSASYADCAALQDITTVTVRLSAQWRAIERSSGADCEDAEKKLRTRGTRAMLPTLPAVTEWSLVFERSGSACVVVSPCSWQVLMVSDRYLQLLKQPRERAI